MPSKKKSLTQMPGSSKRQRADTNLTRAQEKRLAREAEEIRKKAQREKDRMNMPSMMKDGGKLKMVKNKKGEMVPDYAADGVGKMSYGGKAKVKKMNYGGKAKVKKMGMGGQCRGMGAATRGGGFKMG